MVGKFHELVLFLTTFRYLISFVYVCHFLRVFFRSFLWGFSSTLQTLQKALYWSPSTGLSHPINKHRLNAYGNSDSPRKIFSITKKGLNQLLLPLNSFSWLHEWLNFWACRAFFAGADMFYIFITFSFENKQCKKQCLIDASSCIIMHHHASSCVIMRHHASSCVIMRHHASSCVIMRHHASSCVIIIIDDNAWRYLCNTSFNNTLYFIWKLPTGLFRIKLQEF